MKLIKKNIQIASLIASLFFCASSAQADAANPDDSTQATAQGQGATPVATAKKAGKKSASVQKDKQPTLAPGVLPVSSSELTTFIFPHPVKDLIFPGNAVIEGDINYLANKTQVLLQFGKSAKPFQMVVALVNDDVLTTRVQPMDIPGPTHSINGAKKRISSMPESKTPSQSDSPQNGEDIELLKYLVTNGNPPPGFDAINLPGATRFDKFSVVPLSGWSNGDKNVYVFSLVSVRGQSAVVTPPQFYRKGITAVMVDGDVVDEKTSPQLFIVEEANDE